MLTLDMRNVCLQTYRNNIVYYYNFIYSRIKKSLKNMYTYNSQQTKIIKLNKNKK